MRQDLALQAHEHGWVRPLRWQGTLHPEHCHDELEVNVVQRGSGTYLVEGEAVELGPGDIIWLHPDQRHILINQSKDVLIWLIVIKPKLAKQLADDLPTASALAQRSIASDQLVRRMQAADFTICCQMLDDIADFEDQAWVNNALTALVGRIWLAFSRGSKPQRRQLEPLVCQAKAAIEDDPAQVQRDQLARQLGCSPAMLSRRFAQQVGQSLTAYRNYMRLLLVLPKLSSRDDPILELALEAGFGSYPQFHRIFVEMIGATPAQWRKQQREPNDK